MTQLEYWILRREPRHPLGDVAHFKKLSRRLERGHSSCLFCLNRQAAVSPIQLNVDELVGQEIIERAGLTPTDIPACHR